ncbi:MAG: type II toxin-antitoxin system VapC family toxin [Rhodospirillales bacterium]|nr:type II toxin-antitoxin system VapC family toxin [Rhodospirillales bacterium]
MIILDTNVLSAVMQTAPDPSVVSWLDRQPWESVWTTAITTMEIRLGIELLGPGKRRAAIEDAFARMVHGDLDGRVLPFDQSAAEAAAHLAAARRRSGRTVDIRDTQIAGIALVRRGTLATRNARHFQDLNVPVVDPWSA